MSSFNVIGNHCDICGCMWVEFGDGRDCPNCRSRWWNIGTFVKGYVYFARSRSNAEHVKIGWSEKPYLRLQQVRDSGGKLRPELIGVVACGHRGMEKLIHRYFKNLRIHGEWFSVTLSHLVSLYRVQYALSQRLDLIAKKEGKGHGFVAVHIFHATEDDTKKALPKVRKGESQIKPFHSGLLLRPST